MWQNSKNYDSQAVKDNVCGKTQNYDSLAMKDNNTCG